MGENKVEFTTEMLQDHVDRVMHACVLRLVGSFIGLWFQVRGALMIAYPMGLPEWEAARQVKSPSVKG